MTFLNSTLRSSCHCRSIFLCSSSSTSPGGRAQNSSSVRLPSSFLSESQHYRVTTCISPPGEGHYRITICISPSEAGHYRVTLCTTRISPPGAGHKTPPLSDSHHRSYLKVNTPELLHVYLPRGQGTTELLHVYLPRGQGTKLLYCQPSFIICISKASLQRSPCCLWYEIWAYRTSLLFVPLQTA